VAARVDVTRITLVLAVSLMVAIAVTMGFGVVLGLPLFALGVGFGMPRSFHRFAFAPLGRPSPL